jgi:hypothetical protein
MSGAIVGATAGGVAAAVAAAAEAARRRKEEEDMTAYNSDDLDGWEFKIVRASTRKFKTVEAVQKLCQEEARAGWELVEKFDDQRIRFKRRVEKRAGDRHLTIDPYRTHVGSSGVGVAIAVVIGTLLVGAGALAIVLYSAR